jgi:hypothetical protein
LVADSFTKIVSGPAFEKALQDLCIAAGESKVPCGGGGEKQDPVNAKVAIMVGATLMSGAAATSEDAGEDQLSWFWTIGRILMCVGAVYVSDKMVRSGMWLYRRLLGTSKWMQRSKGNSRHLNSTFCTGVAVKKKVRDVWPRISSEPTMCLQPMLMNFVPWCLRVGESKRIPTTRCMEELQRCMKMSRLSCRGVEKRKLRRNDWIQMRKKQL